MLLFLAACGDDNGSTPMPVIPQVSPVPVPAPEPEPSILNLGFYTQTFPISGLVDGEHAGYEAGLVDGLEAMDGAGFRFERHPRHEWPGHYLLSSTDEYDVMTGGIWIRDSRRFDEDGVEQVAFTDGHLTNSSTFLVRAEDAGKYSVFGPLPDGSTIAVSRDGASEIDVLVMHGYASEDGVLIEGMRVFTPSGVVVADGTDAYRIRTGDNSPSLAGRTLILPPDEGARIYVIRPGLTLDERVELLIAGEIDVFLRDEITGLYLQNQWSGQVVISAIGDLSGTIGFTVDVDDVALLHRLNEAINYLTNDGAIDFETWLANPTVFTERALAWPENR